MKNNIIREWMKDTLEQQSPLLVASEFQKKLLKVIIDVPEKPKTYNPLIQIPKENVVLTSGGLDSTVLYYMTPEPKKCWYIDFGQDYAEKEIAVLEKLKIPFYVFEEAKL